MGCCGGQRGRRSNQAKAGNTVPASARSRVVSNKRVNARNNLDLRRPAHAGKQTLPAPSLRHTDLGNEPRNSEAPSRFYKGKFRLPE